MCSVQPSARITSTHCGRRSRTPKISGYQISSQSRCWPRILRISSTDMPIQFLQDSTPIDRSHRSATSRFHLPEQNGLSLPTSPPSVVKPGSRIVSFQKMSSRAKSDAWMIDNSSPTEASAGRMNPSTNGHVDERSRPVFVMYAISGLGNFPCLMSVAIAPLCVPPPHAHASILLLTLPRSRSGGENTGN